MQGGAGKHGVEGALVEAIEEIGPIHLGAQLLVPERAPQLEHRHPGHVHTGDIEGARGQKLGVGSEPAAHLEHSVSWLYPA